MSDDGLSERVFVTGAGGFVGGRLVAQIRKQKPNWAVITPGIDGQAFDIRDLTSVRIAIAEARPTIVIHLAAVSAVTVARDNPREAWDVNLGGTLNIVDGIKREASGARLLHVSTAEVYGASFDSGPVDETSLLKPLNTYAASKAAADLMVCQEAVEGFCAIVARPFNHVGAGQAEAFAMPAFAAQIARIEVGLQPPTIAVGELEDERDFLDVDDVVDAYMMLLFRLDRWAPGEILNIASGNSVKVGEMLQMLIGHAHVPVTIEVDPARLRRKSISRVRTDASRLRKLTSWSPTRSLDHTLNLLLDYERARLKLAAKI